MFELRLVLTTQPDGTKLLRLTRGFRLAFGLIVVFIAVGSFTTGTISTLPAILAVISLFATFYDERWHFDATTGKVTRIFGLVFLHKSTIHRFDNAECFEYTRFAEGSGPSPAATEDSRQVMSPRRRFQRQFETLSLVLADGDRIDIEKHRSRSQLELQDTAEKLAEYCGLPLEAN